MSEWKRGYADVVIAKDFDLSEIILKGGRDLDSFGASLAEHIQQLITDRNSLRAEVSVLRRENEGLRLSIARAEREAGKIF